MSIKSKEDLLNKQAEVNEQIKSYTCRVLVCSGTGCTKYAFCCLITVRKTSPIIHRGRSSFQSS